MRELEAKVAAETDATKKAEMQEKLKTVTANVDKINKQMFKAYGYSVLNNYILVVERQHVYMRVTNEEAAKFKYNLEKARSAIADNEDDK